MARRAATARSAPREATLDEQIADSGETPADAAAAAEREAREDLLFLAREFLTWLVFHVEVDGGRFEGAGEVAPFTVGFGGRLSLRSPAGMVTDLALKGPSPVGSPDLRYALAGGLSVKEADLVIEQGEQIFRFGLAAEHLDLKRVKLPQVLASRNPRGARDERASDERGEELVEERLSLLATLDATLKYAFANFLELRMKPAWARITIPAIRAWLDEGT